MADAASSDYGRVIENVIYLELRRRCERVWTGKNRDREVDFVVQDNEGDIEYFQVALSVRDETTRNRELAAFNTMDHYPKHLLTMDPEEGSYNGIQQTNILKWLAVSF